MGTTPPWLNLTPLRIFLTSNIFLLRLCSKAFFWQKPREERMPPYFLCMRLPVGFGLDEKWANHIFQSLLFNIIHVILHSPYWIIHNRHAFVLLCYVKPPRTHQNHVLPNSQCKKSQKLKYFKNILIRLGQWCDLFGCPFKIPVFHLLPG